ncbi:MAG: UDP-2,3-diacylglucosamine diphosphatase [Deltaproteobacteria bacterium]|nr:UDP-2,3-diacylglucosamine diphosphatase [Deltaproteobacteria bacterium]
MKVFFVADGHLKGLDDPNQKSLVAFLSRIEPPDTLVILGDLFEFWTGSNKVAMSRYAPVLDALATLRKNGVRVIYLEGNHDFSIGKGALFADTLGIEVHADSFEFSLDGKRVFLSHGDIVSMSLGYALWRGFVRSGLCRFIVALLPDKTVWNAAMRLSRQSRRNSYAEGALDEGLKGFAIERIRAGFDAIVMGHSHSPGVHRLDSLKPGAIYANTGSWADHGNHLIYEASGFRNERFG